jgi:pyruvate ferredoxin oxidoreductase gamma subunit/phenylglyoxylate dehydrogenase gamma subunit
MQGGLAAKDGLFLEGSIHMKEIRLHGIGGLGTVKAGEMLVHAAVNSGKYGNSIPFFGFERQGAPVTSYVRLGDEKIRAKNQVYTPDCTIVLDQSLLVSAPVFEGLAEDSFFVLNTRAEDPKPLIKNPNVKCLAYLNATPIAMEMLGRPITNTIMLGAFVKATGWVDQRQLEEVIQKFFGEKNVAAFRRGYDEVNLYYFR